MSRLDDFRRMRTLQFVVLLIFSVIGCRLFYLQILDTKYKRLAEGNALRHEVQYPPRGEVFDRNGEYLVKSKECYDLMVVWREMDRAGFDTMRMCSILNLSKKRLMRKLADARMSPRKACLVTNFVSKEDKLRFDACNFKGFFTVYRTVREYPRKVGGNLLGYVGEVNQRDIDRDDYYRMGDYIGKSGVESAYEEVLRGTKGVKITEVDTHGATKDRKSVV